MVSYTDIKIFMGIEESKESENYRIWDFSKLTQEAIQKGREAANKLKMDIESVKGEDFVEVNKKNGRHGLGAIVRTLRARKSRKGNLSYRMKVEFHSSDGKVEKMRLLTAGIKVGQFVKLEERDGEDVVVVYDSKADAIRARSTVKLAPQIITPEKKYDNDFVKDLEIAGDTITFESNGRGHTRRFELDSSIRKEDFSVNIKESSSISKSPNLVYLSVKIGNAQGKILLKGNNGKIEMMLKPYKIIPDSDQTNLWDKYRANLTENAIEIFPI